MPTTPPPDEQRHQAIGAEVRTLCEAGDVDGATSRVIAVYGPELHGFLNALAKDTDLGSEAFAATCERIWKYLPGFRWEAPLRAWAYQIARNALRTLQADPRRRAERNVPLSVIQSLEAVARSRTAPYQRTEIKDAMRELRESLDPEDHEVLILRIDRGMSWKEIALATASDDAPTNVDQRAAALRKRYERTKAQLRELAIARGLLES